MERRIARQNVEISQDKTAATFHTVGQKTDSVKMRILQTILSLGPSNGSKIERMFNITKTSLFKYIENFSTKK